MPPKSVGSGGNLNTAQAQRRFFQSQAYEGIRVFWERDRGGRTYVMFMLVS